MRDSAGVEHWYDVKNDPRELIDLKAKKSARVKRVAKELLLSFGGEWPRPTRAQLDPGRRAELRALEAAR